jgi:hypothetical protein
MTDRIAALTVVLDTDIRADDIQPLIDAILMLRRVISVKWHVADPGQHIANQRARHELAGKIMDILQ